MRFVSSGLCLAVPQLRTVLLLQRSAPLSEPLTWACPGGHLEPRETPLQAARREFAEETGVKPRYRPMGHVDTIGPSGAYRLFVGAVDEWEASRIWRTMRLNWESADAQWASLKTPPAPLHPGLRAAWDQIAEIVRGQ